MQATLPTLDWRSGNGHREEISGLLKVVTSFSEGPTARAMKTEKPLKQWVAEKAIKDGVTPRAIFQRLRKGVYPTVRLHRINARVIYVGSIELPR